MIQAVLTIVTVVVFISWWHFDTKRNGCDLLQSERQLADLLERAKRQLSPDHNVALRRELVNLRLDKDRSLSAAGNGWLDEERELKGQQISLISRALETRPRASCSNAEIAKGKVSVS